MSWFIGHHISKGNIDLSKIHSKNNLLHSEQIGNFYFQAGGIPETCRFLKIAKSKMIVLGLPIASNSLEILSDKNLLLRLNNMNFDNLTGAYTLIIFAENKIRITCDNLNFRKIYYYHQDNEFILSTDLIWINKIKKLNTDINSLGIYWNLGHSNEDKSLFQQVKTINSECSLELDAQLREIKQEHPHNRKLPEYSADAKKLVKEKISIFVKNLGNKHLSLSLSGGLDSRTILALLLQHKNPFITHTFGESNNYDVIIAKQLAKDFNFKNLQFDGFKKLDKNSLVEKMKQISQETEMTQSLVSFPLYGYFQELYPKTDLIIDGGFICYLRKVTNNKIIMFNKHVFINNDIPKIYSLLKLTKPDVFYDDIKLELDKNANSHLANILEEYKITKNKDIGDWLDLVKFRVMNSYYFAPSQRVYDEFIPNIMVGAQDFFTDLVFAIPPKQRKNYKINLNIIQGYSTKLKNIPYARYNSFVKRLTTVHLDYLQAKINQKLGNVYTRSDSHYFLNQLEEWFYDTLNSSKLANNELLDHKKISSLLDKYYHKEEKGYANDVMKTFQVISFLGEE